MFRAHWMLYIPTFIYSSWLTQTAESLRSFVAQLVPQAQTAETYGLEMRAEVVVMREMLEPLFSTPAWFERDTYYYLVDSSAYRTTF